MLREHAQQVETDRRIANHTIEAIVGAGLARILQPRRWGGYEISHDAAFDVAVEIASACGSTGWCASLLNIHDWWLAAFPEEAQHDVWRDTPDRNLAAMVYPTGKADAGRRRLSAFRTLELSSAASITATGRSSPRWCSVRRVRRTPDNF